MSCLLLKQVVVEHTKVLGFPWFSTIGYVGRVEELTSAGSFWRAARETVV
jgi:hypothetical protein